MSDDRKPAEQDERTRTGTKEAAPRSDRDKQPDAEAPQFHDWAAI